jgi:hypothetical protein
MIPKTLVIGTPAKQPVFRRHKPRSKPNRLLKVFELYRHHHRRFFSGMPKRAVVRWS